MPLLNTASIIIVTYNGMEYLPECLNSVFSDVKDRCEIIVFDNYSSDNTVQYISETFPSIKLIRSDTNLGFAAGCNKAVEFATGSYLVFLNQDSVVYPGWLDELLKGFCDPSIGLVSSKTLILQQESLINSCGLDIHYTGLSFSRGFQESTLSFCEPEAINAVTGACFAIPKFLWTQLGGFDETFFMYYEETDLSWRAQLLGYSSWFQPSSVIAHHYSQTKSYASIYFSERNRILMLLKNYKPVTLVLLLPAFLITEFLQWFNVFLIARDAMRAKFKAVLWIFGNCRSIINGKKLTPPQRKIQDNEILIQRGYRIKVLEKNTTLIGKIAISITNFIYYVLFRFTYTVLKSIGQ